MDTQRQTDSRHKGREEGTRDDSKTAVRETLVAGLKETSSLARGQTGWEGGRAGGRGEGDGPARARRRTS